MKIYMGTTKIDVNKTLGEISSLLVRIGARQITTDYGVGGTVAAVRFGLSIPNLAAPVHYRLPCRTEKLLAALHGDRRQAERTAWRQVLRWVEAQAAMIDAAMTSAHEVFMPYALIPGTQDRTVAELWESQQKRIAGPK